MKFTVAFLLALFSLSTLASPSKPEETFLKSCLMDYVTAFSAPLKESESLSTKVRERCLSKDFLANWNGIVSVDGTGSDGILLAQDYFE